MILGEDRGNQHPSSTLNASIFQHIIFCACIKYTYILASHSAAGHLEVVLSVVLGVKWVLGAGMKQPTHRLLILKHQVNIAFTRTEQKISSFASKLPHP